jgi:CRISPR/Cas system CSM-associated protein Csm2 small subunit
MRIEEVASGQFIKVPNNLEQKMIKTMNRFFETGEDAVKGSREDIILEVEKRIRPLIANMVKRVAWLEGKEIFEEQLKAVLDEQLASIIDEVMKTVKDMRAEIIKFVPMKFVITHTTDFVLFPPDILLDTTKDVIQVFVNGLKQELDDNYTYMLTSAGKINGISFDTNALDIDDIVKLDCFVYSELSSSSSGSTTP